MRIYKIASVDTDIAGLKDTIRGLKDDIRDLKKDNKETSSKVKKIDDILEKLNIGTRRVTQVQTSFTELQRKVEKFEVVMGQWQNFKKEMDSDTRRSVEKTTKGQVKASGTKIYKLARFSEVYNIIKITETDGVAKEEVLKDSSGYVVEIKADSPEQARRFAKNSYPRLSEWENEYAGRTIVARLNKEKMERRKKNIERDEKNVQEMWWNKD